MSKSRQWHVCSSVWCFCVYFFFFVTICQHTFCIEERQMGTLTVSHECYLYAISIRSWVSNNNTHHLRVANTAFWAVRRALYSQLWSLLQMRSGANCGSASIIAILLPHREMRANQNSLLSFFQTHDNWSPWAEHALSDQFGPCIRSTSVFVASRSVLLTLTCSGRVSTWVVHAW